MEQTLEEKAARSERFHELYRYYADKKYCQIDMDKLDWRFGSDNGVPSSHPIIKFELFLEQIKKRNRLQSTLSEIEKHKSEAAAQAIYGSRFSIEHIIQELNEKIRAVQIKIEQFHAEYYI